MNDATTTGTRRPAFWGIGVLGLLLILFPFVIYLIYGIVTGDEETAFFVIPTAVLAFTAFALWRWDGRWARIGAIVITLAAGLLFFFVAFGIFHPASPLDFVPSISFILGFILSLGGTIAAFRSARRQRYGRAARERSLRIAALGLVGLAAVFSFVAFFATRETVSAEAASGAAVVDMKNFKFVPSEIVAAPGGTLLVKNSDAFAHDFTLAAAGVSFDLNPGSERLVQLGSLASGDYVVLCDLHSSSGDFIDADGNPKTDAPRPDPEEDGMVAALVIR